MTTSSDFDPSLPARRVSETVSLEMHDDVAVLVIDHPPVNAISRSVRQGLIEGLGAALATSGTRAVLVTCAGRTFCAGADITEFGLPTSEPDLNLVLAAIEDSPVPVIAVLHGTALGGGLELALACHYRIADQAVGLGLPEVTLGLLPGGGGTQRLPRLVGVRTAIDVIAGGRPLDGAVSLAAGLIDAVAPGTSLVDDAILYARRLIKDGNPLPRARDRSVDLSPEETLDMTESYRRAHPRAFVGFRAPTNILRAIEASAALPFEDGLVRERQLFNELLDSQESAAQRHLFFAERAAGKIIGLDPDVKPRTLATAAVIGAGTMGSGIAIALLASGLSVVLVDANDEALANGAARISRTLRANAEKGRVSSAEAELQVGRLEVSKTLGACSAADLVIEAVFERLELKTRIFAELDAIAKPTAILASNTSFLDLNAIADATRRPETVVGLHFFAPANVMRLLEVVRGARTSDETVATAMALGRRLGKVAVLSGVCHGFIANRLMAKRAIAAQQLILEGALPWDIDRALRTYGFPMGEFEMQDLVGLDVIGWDKDNSAGRTVQEILCEAGRWGQKTKAGYYDYLDGRAPSPSVAAVEAIRAIRERLGGPMRTFTDAELLQRLLDPVVNEGAAILEEGIAQRASDIDVALVTGYGWPTYRGGPMFWGDTAGLGAIADRLRVRQDPDTPVSQHLERLISGGRRFVRDGTRLETR